MTTLTNFDGARHRRFSSWSGARYDRQLASSTAEHAAPLDRDWNLMASDDGGESGELPVSAQSTLCGGTYSSSSISALRLASVLGTPSSAARLSAVASSRRILPATASLVSGGSCI